MTTLLSSTGLDGYWFDVNARLRAGELNSFDRALFFSVFGHDHL